MDSNTALALVAATLGMLVVVAAVLSRALAREGRVPAARRDTGTRLRIGGLAAGLVFTGLAAGIVFVALIWFVYARW